jgi:hypothetical protein
MTGTPLDLTPFGSVLTSISAAYWLLALVAVVVALKRPKTKRGRAVAAAIVVVLFGALPARGMWESYAAHSRLRESMAVFEERCKTSGEKISRTVENVDGIVWLKWRGSHANLDNQFAMDDPYGHDCGGEDCMVQLLRITRDVDRNPEGARQHKGGYTFVETIDPKDGRWYRYFGAMKLTSAWTAEGIATLKRETGGDPPSFSYRASFERESIDKPTGRYGLTWDDISTRADRERWITGGSLKVIDLQTKEVIGERVGYLIDRGQGSTAGFRTPWSWARSYGPSCPPPQRTRDFISKVLKPN